MRASGVLVQVANELIAIRMRAMELILPYYDERVAKQVFVERDLLLQLVEGLDDDLSNLMTRCAQAKSSEPLVEEMRNLRVRGLRLFRFLYISRLLLRVAHRRLKTEARMDGLDGEISVLKSELSMSEGDEVLSLVNRVLKKPPKPVSRREERLALFRTVRLIATSRFREFSFGRVGRSYAASMRQLIRTSTKRILKEQFIVLGEVIWRIVQPTLLPLVAGFFIMYMIHMALEVFEIHFFSISRSVLLAIVAAYLLEKIMERVFEQFHLRRFRKSCVDTAIRIFAAEVRARANSIGIVVISTSQLKQTEDVAD
jgi:hypothetical protein